MTSNITDAMRHVLRTPSDTDAPRVHRPMSFDLPTFDAFKAFQRALERDSGLSVSNGDALRVLILSHLKA